MDKNKAEVEITGEDSLFVIKNNNIKQECELFSYGKPGVGAIDITVSYIGAILKRIDCAYSNDMVEMDMHLPEPEELNIPEEKVMYFYPPEKAKSNNDCGEFQIAYNPNEMDVIFGDVSKAARFCRNDRVEYYLDENDELLYFRVRHLTPEEYNCLCSQKKNSDEIGQRTR